MTVEHKMTVGLEEIKAIIFECNTCKSRTVLSPENIQSPPASCPLRHNWDWNTPAERHLFFEPFMSFFTALKSLRDPLSQKVGFRILLEFEDHEHNAD